MAAEISETQACLEFHTLTVAVRRTCTTFGHTIHAEDLRSQVDAFLIYARSA